MIAVDEAALECDLAETYGIFEYRRLPARRVAVFASGLGADSRSARAASGAKVPLNTMLLALIADTLTVLIWRDKAKRPKLMTELLTGQDEGSGTGFDTVDEFDAWRARMVGGMNNGK